MPLNILEIAKTADAASWRETYGFPLHWGQHSENDRRRILSLVSAVATQVIDRCSQEISATSVQAPDAQIVKEKITSALRLLAADARMHLDKCAAVSAATEAKDVGVKRDQPPLLGIFFS